LPVEPDPEIAQLQAESDDGQKIEAEHEKMQPESCFPVQPKLFLAPSWLPPMEAKKAVS
jgi:hypothetical protein